MEDVARPRKWSFIFVVGVLLWGGGTALSVTLLNWYDTGHLDSPWSIAGCFLIFMIGGILFGRSMWKLRSNPLPSPMAIQTGKMGRFVLFVALMLGLIFLLWKMR